MPLFGSHLAQDQRHKDRTALLRLLIEESTKTGDRPALRTWTDGSKWMWRTERDGPHYDYRAMLGNELCFDIGDDIDGESRPWADTVRDVTAILNLLNWLGEPYWCSLTDGKGWHIQLFLEPGVDRDAVAKSLIACCNAGFEAHVQISNGFRCDRRLLDPNEGSRQIREFGARKNGNTPYGKALWAVGPGPFEPIPNTREATYRRLAERIGRGEDLRMPRSIAHGMPLVHLLPTQQLARSHGGTCPKGSECLPGPHRESLDWGTCLRCPIDN